MVVFSIVKIRMLTAFHFLKPKVAKVGVGADPESMDITKDELDNLILWDSQGLGVRRLHLE